MRPALKPVDILSIVFIALLAIVTLVSLSVVSDWPQFIFKYSLFALIIISLAALDRKTSGMTFFHILHAFIPIVIILLVFNSLGELIPRIRDQYYDNDLIRIDYALFGAHPTVWMERFNTAILTGLLQIAYISYYFMPIALGTFLFLKKKQHAFDSAVFTIVLCFYLSYIGYLLVPAVGPRFTLNQVQTVDLQTGPVTLWIRSTLDGLEQNKTDAFPSGHTAVALVSLLYAWKYREKVLFWILVPAVSALIVSTVYLRYHYVVDVIAGILLAALTVLIAPKTYRLFSGLSDRPQG
jgi:membrane-associated phospholipid phosphatase